MIGYLLYRLWSLFTSSGNFHRLIQTTGIVVFVGPNGSGKSLAMVEGELGALAGMEWECWDAEHRHHRAFVDHCGNCQVCELHVYLPHGCSSTAEVHQLIELGVICDMGARCLIASARGVRQVYSTVPLTVSKGVPHPLYVPLTDYRQLLTIEHSDVLFDEVAGIADASASASMPVQVVNWQHKLRKADIRQRVTTPAYQRCALPIRQVAQIVVECKAFLPSRTVGKLWRPRRLVVCTAYDAWTFDAYIASDAQREKLRPVGKALIWVSKSRALDCYNTLGQVLSLGHVTDSGMCIACGGARSRPKCGCLQDHDDPAATDLVIETSVTASGSRTRRAVLGAQ